MAFEHYIRSGQKQLRCGYTTGTCAALAAAGAARLFLTGEVPELLRLTTPKGLVVEVEPAYCRMREPDSGQRREDASEKPGTSAVCAVRKDAGDDPDITDGVLVVAEVSALTEEDRLTSAERTRKGRIPRVEVDGGEGVGRVTRPGLDQAVGEAAINRVPRQMIGAEVHRVLAECGRTDSLRVIISVPGGEEMAEHTFNPQLGIEGGISILGTSGIVEPMSEQALVDTIALSVRQAFQEGNRRLILTPGNYGEDFLAEKGLDSLGIPVVRFSNYLGEALDLAAGYPYREVLLVGHIGKLVKLAGGIMNTHSRYADCRMELFCAYAAACGAPASLCRELLSAATTDACIAHLLTKDQALADQVMRELLSAMQRHLDLRVRGAYQTGVVTFSNQYGLLGMTDEAETILKNWKDE